MTARLKRVVLLIVSVMALALAVAPFAFAGENCSDDNSCQSSGGSDTGSASGGAQTGFGGLAAKPAGNGTMVIGLATGGLLVLTAAGLTARRRETTLDA